jgi:hypothetical protein
MAADLSPSATSGGGTGAVFWVRLVATQSLSPSGQSGQESLIGAEDSGSHPLGCVDDAGNAVS